jgi:hypothetical protein
MFKKKKKRQSMYNHISINSRDIFFFEIIN